MSIRNFKLITVDECDHSYVVKGDIDYACRECTKCGHWEIL